MTCAVQYHRFDQTGSLTEEGETGLADYAFDTVGVDAGVQYALTPRVIVTLGYRFEDRRLDNIETAAFTFNTRKNGGFGSLRWDVSRRLKLTIEYEHSAYDDPFSLISPTSFDRLRFSAN